MRRKISVMVSLPEMLEPSVRDARFTDPLERALATASAGTVAGAGTDFLLKTSEIDVQLKDLDRLQSLREALSSLEVPNGTRIRYRRDGAFFVDVHEGDRWTIGLMQA